MINTNSVIVGNFNTPLSPKVKWSGQKINRNFRIKWHITSNRHNRYLYPNAKEYTFYSKAHGRFSKIEYILGHKENLNKYRKTELYPDSFLGNKI